MTETLAEDAAWRIRSASENINLDANSIVLNLFLSRMDPSIKKANMKSVKELIVMIRKMNMVIEKCLANLETDMVTEDTTPHA